MKNIIKDLFHRLSDITRNAIVFFDKQSKSTQQFIIVLFALIIGVISVQIHLLGISIIASFIVVIYSFIAVMDMLTNSN
jgi:type IV secretory pathway VirB6-like protein